MIEFSSSGSFDKTEAMLKKLADGSIFSALGRFGQEGVNALASATPKDDGTTANSWTYEIIQNGSEYSIIWGNTNINDGVNIAVILQYGHGTGSGGYVEGRDYINPALRPVFDRILSEAWKAVTSA